MSGKVSRGECAPGGRNDQWESTRLVFDLHDAALDLAQPSTFTHLFVATPEGGGPQTAVVTPHAIASVRTLAGPTNQIVSLFTPDLPGPVAHPSAGPAAPPGTEQRGGLPQYRVTFNDGSPGGIKVYCDAHSVLSLPCRNVSIDAFTPPILAAATADPAVQVGPGLICQADVSANVAWGMEAAASAPCGYATFSQAASTVAPLEPILFDRAPFAKRVTVIPPSGIGSVMAFMASPAAVLVTPPPVANTIQRSQPVPALATHVRVTLAPGTPAGVSVVCIWELGV